MYGSDDRRLWYLKQCQSADLVQRMLQRIEQLANGQAEDAACLVHVLGDMEATAAVPLLVRLSRTDPGTNWGRGALRDSARIALSDIATRPCQMELLERFCAPGGDEDATLIICMGDLRYKGGPDALLPVLCTKSRWCRVEAIGEYLESFHSFYDTEGRRASRAAVVSLAHAQDERVRQAAIGLMAGFDRAACEALSVERTSHPDAEVRLHAIEQLARLANVGELGSTRVDWSGHADLLLRLTDDPDARVREQAFGHLSAECDLSPDLEPRVLAWLDSPHLEARAHAAGMAARLHLTSALPRLIRNFLDWPDPGQGWSERQMSGMTERAIEQVTCRPLAIGAAPTDEGTPVEKRVEQVLQYQVWHASHAAEPREEWIFEAAQQASAVARLLAIEQMEPLATTRAGDKLAAMLTDPEYHVRRAACDAFRRMTGHHFGFDICAEVDPSDAHLMQLRGWWKENRTRTRREWLIDTVQTNLREEHYWEVLDSFERVASSEDRVYLEAVLDRACSEPSKYGEEFIRCVARTAARMGSTSAPRIVSRMLRGVDPEDRRYLGVSNLMGEWFGFDLAICYRTEQQDLDRLDRWLKENGDRLAWDAKNRRYIVRPPGKE